MVSSAKIHHCTGCCSQFQLCRDPPPAASQGPGILRLQTRLGLPNMEVQQETFLELLGKESPMQPLRARPYSSHPGTLQTDPILGFRGLPLLSGSPVELWFSADLEPIRAAVPRHCQDHPER